MSEVLNDSSLDCLRRNSREAALDAAMDLALFDRAREAADWAFGLRVLGWSVSPVFIYPT